MMVMVVMVVMMVMPFGFPWQQVGSISLAHCDSWEILCLDVFYGCVLVG